VLAQDAVNNQSAPSSVTYTVSQATPTITWANPAAITYGTALSATQLNATASVAGTFVYTPAAGTVLTAGTQTLSVTFTPTDTTNYTNASATVQLVVNRATPTLIWPTPAAISYGMPLSATQLNATSNVPGTFLYTPPAGTVLPAGTQTLSVIFTPTDTLDYTPASGSVTIVVTQAQISLSPSSINFGTVVFGKTVSQPVTVTNVGNAGLKITKVSVTLGPGSDRDDFALWTNCGSSVAPGASCSIVVSFLADDLGSHASTLVVTDNAPGSPHQVGITANVVKRK
jgi:hypothetical protein